MPVPKTYDEWLSLTPEQQQLVHFNEWNVYAWEGRAFPFMAAARLMFASQIRILDIRVGIYHGGEYLLEPTVANQDYPTCPARLQQTFEGFRVYWHPERYAFSPADAAKFRGTWVCENELCDVEFVISNDAEHFAIRGRRRSGEPVEVGRIEFDGHRLEFEAVIPSLHITSLQRFSILDENRCENAPFLATIWKRKTGN